MKKNKILVLILTLVLLVSTMGCSNKPQKPMNSRDNIDTDLPNDLNVKKGNENIRGIEKNIRDTMPKKDTNIDPNVDNNRNNLVDQSNNMSKRADAIAKKVTDLNEVNSCSVLLAGNTCIVGVNMKNNIEGKTTSDLKQKIEKTVKNTDKEVKNVNITADPDIYKRISNMATDIGDGNPVKGFVDEFEEILRRITPIK